jgi:protein SCO1
MNGGRALRIGLPLLCGIVLLLAYLRPVASSDALPPAGFAAPAPAPTSLYGLRSSWLMDDERHVQLGWLKGHFQVLALIFTRCSSVCPTLVRDLRRLQQRMPASVAAATRFTLVSIDPEHDTPAVLRAYRSEHGLGADDWMLLRGEPDDVRELAATLGFSFATDDAAPSAHSKLVTLLDRDGTVLHQQAGLDADPDRIIQLVAEAL